MVKQPAKTGFNPLDENIFRKRTMKKSFVLIILLLLIVNLIASAQEDPVDIINSLYLNVELAPAVKAIDNAVSSARKDIETADDLPEPMVGFSYAPSPIATRGGPQDWMMTVKQPFPWPGKLNAFSEIADGKYKLVKAFKSAAIASLREQISKLVWQAYWLDRQIEIAQKEFELWNELEASTNSLYSTGESSQAALLRIQAMQSSIEGRIVTLESKRNALQTSLQGILDDNKLNLPKTAAVEKLIPLLDVKTLITIADTHNPSIESARASVLKSTAKLNLAKSLSYPDFAVQFGYLAVGDNDLGNEYSDKDAWNVGISATIPLWINKNRNQRESANSSLQSAELNLVDTQSKVEGRIKSLLEEIEGLEEAISIQLHKTLARSWNAFNAARSAYSAGDTGFAQLIDAENGWLKAELKLHDLIQQRGLLVAQLEAFVGSEIYNLNK
ncbi:MAG: TolC family protein [candidate division Zixibacteria bacterium]|nr:TolC family protein [Candidatus Tariuqbacter arcticus]